MSFEERAANTVAGYRIILRVESALRQLIADELTAKAGSRWHRQRLPADLIPKMKNSATFERSFKWFEFIPHHPVCYLDFPDLEKIISRQDNWRDCFEAIFARKERLQANFRDVELIRNKIAHSRVISRLELETLQHFESDLLQCFGPSKYEQLLEAYVPIGDVREHLRKLRSSLIESRVAMLSAKCLDIAPSFDTLEQNWWFDSDFIPIDVESTLQLFARIREYQRLPREARDGYKIEGWVRDQHLLQSIDAVVVQLEQACER